MERTSSVSDLLARVELALLRGRNLEQIETELLARGPASSAPAAA
jgi:hypothetical protein